MVREFASDRQMHTTSKTWPAGRAPRLKPHAISAISLHWTLQSEQIQDPSLKVLARHDLSSLVIGRSASSRLQPVTRLDCIWASFR